MHFLGLLRRSSKPRPDRPYRLVSHNGTGESPDTEIFDYRAQLAPDNLKSLARLTLLAGFTHAQDRNQATRLNRRKLATDHTIAFTQNQATLGVTDQHQGTIRIGQLTGCDFARQGALHRLNRAILRTDGNRLSIQTLNDLIDVQTGRKNRHIDTRGKSQLTQAFDQLHYAGAGTVHFPITGHQGSTHAVPR